MKNRMLVLTTSVAILACGTIAASAQQQSPAGPSSGGPMMRQQQDQQDTIRERLRGAGDDDRNDTQGYGGGMGGMMGGYGRGMMGRNFGPWMHHGGWGRREGGGPGMMGGLIAPRIIFSLMDSDGDGKLSLDEFRAAHDKIFKAMDANKDGFVTLQEMLEFMRGGGRSASQP